MPIVAISTDTGECNILSVNNVSNPIVLKSFYLTKESLNQVKFSWMEKVLGVAAVNDGKLFIIKGFESMKLEVMTLVEIPEKIIDFLIYEEENGDITVLILIHHNIMVGKNIIIYKIGNSNNKINQLGCIIELPNIFKHLHYGQTQNDIFVNPYLTKQLYQINFQVNK